MLWERLARPNVMIKVPATEAGIAAIEELTARGVNVNVTLLFSVERYEQVIDAYLRGLERARRAGEPIDAIASVASFFVSRVDTKADAAARRPTRPCAAAWRRQRPARLQPLPRALRRRALGGAARRRRPPAAAAVGQHRDQEPRLLRRALRRGADRSRRGQHDARGTPCAPSPTTATPAASSTPSAGAAEQILREAEARGRRPRRGHRASSSAKACRSFCASYQQLLDRIETRTRDTILTS